MKSSLALLATAAAVSASFTKTEWIVHVVTVTVTVDPTDSVQTSQPISTPTPEPVSTSSAAPSPPSPISVIAEEPKSITTTTTTTTEAPPPPSTIESEPVVQTSSPEPQPETTTTKPEPETTTKPQPTSQPEPETPAPADGYQATAVKYHNAYRKDHSAGELSWDSTLAEYALQLAQTCKFAHDTSMGGDDFRFGQNLASAGSTNNLGSMESAVGSAISKQWYQGEVNNYNFYGQKDPPPGADFMKFGHFSQLVWKNTQKVGCATYQCPPGGSFSMPTLYTVCNYSPPGNFQGQYDTNVMPSLGLKVSL